MLLKVGENVNSDKENEIIDHVTKDFPDDPPENAIEIKNRLQIESSKMSNDKDTSNKKKDVPENPFETKNRLQREYVAEQEKKRQEEQNEKEN